MSSALRGDHSATFLFTLHNLREIPFTKNFQAKVKIGFISTLILNICDLVQGKMNADSWLLKAAALECDKMFDQASNAFQTALKIRPTSEEGRLFLLT